MTVAFFVILPLDNIKALLRSSLRRNAGTLRGLPDHDCDSIDTTPRLRRWRTTGTGRNVWNIAAYGCFVEGIVVWRTLTRPDLTRKRIIAVSVLGSVLSFMGRASGGRNCSGGALPYRANKEASEIRRLLEVTPGFEPGNQGFADPCLTTWLCHRLSGKKMERATRLELATSTLARWRSTR